MRISSVYQAVKIERTIAVLAEVAYLRKVIQSLRTREETTAVMHTSDVSHLLVRSAARKIYSIRPR